MTEKNKNFVVDISYKDFIFKNPQNRLTVLIAIFGILFEFAIFKYFYPFANYIFGDSFSYLTAALENRSVSIYLIGYSKFLRLFSVFTKSDLVLTAFQYLIIQATTLNLLFTLCYFYQPSKVVQHILIWFTVLNPLVLYLGNTISSDGLFLALSMLWFTFLIWLINKPSRGIIIGLSVVLFLCFTIRYNALIYPIITGVAYFLSNMRVLKKIYGLGLGILLCFIFFIFTSYEYKKVTGIWQYSPFSGWQLANNAMYAYRYVDSSERKKVPEKYHELDNMIREYFDSTRDIRRHPLEMIQASTWYMWSPGLSLMKYRNKVFIQDSMASDLKKWASMGPYYKSYGLYIIMQYPKEFLRYFIWPNTKKYFAPPIEFLYTYNTGRDSVNSLAQNWFEYRSQRLTTRTNDTRISGINFFPIMSGVTNVLMLCSLIFYCSLKGGRYSKKFQKVILLCFWLWLINAAFTICASSAALRFQAFPVLLTTIAMLLLIDWMVCLMLGKLQIAETSINKEDIISENVKHALF